MATKEPRIDEYIKKAQPFAKPILTHFRKLVHQACPDVEEAIKWGMPFFLYHGTIMCHTASFKQHAAIGFFKAALMKDGALLTMAHSETAMGHLGKITSLDDLPPDKKLIGYIKEAMKLNEERAKLPQRPKVTEKKKKELETPKYLLDALRKNKKAKEAFDHFPYSHKKEYIEWFEEAKTSETRERRLAQGIEMMADGKSRNWKYMKK